MRSMLKTALLAGVAACATAGAWAQSPTGPAATETIVVTGTRVEDRSALDTAVPVDVVQGEALQRLGVTEVNQALSVALPSFNFPRPALNDGTDTVRPAALRGLAPDQTLVLVNSKRRHSAALVNVNGSIGRCSSAVDLNTIPASAISAVEVLRDGASAQYGSDAIAGVINVRLREAASGGALNTTYGQRITTYEVPVTPPVAGLPITAPPTIEREREDGEQLIVSGWKGFGLGAAGFLTVAGEYRVQDRTERPGFDTRQQYPRPTPTTFDAREATIDRWNAWTGEPELDQYTLFANAGYDVADGVELYGWGSYQVREATSAGFFRRALDERNVIQIYPNGFLPKINPEVTDAALAAGSRFALAGWDFDVSGVFGGNRMEFTIRDTLNRSLGPASPTSFDAGGFEYDQFVGNLSAVRGFEVGLASPLNVATGLEFRRERYEIFAGEPGSYINGGVLLPLGGTGCTAPTPAQTAAGGCASASGSQVFPGFRPSDELQEDRTAVGVFVDLEANVTDAFLVSTAVRGESYSDFGEALTGKLSLRYDFTDAFALRGSVQNGFRAPSLQQQYFRTTSTNFINGVPFDVTTFPVDDPIAITLGAQPLDAEKSVNYAIGAVLQLADLNVTLDAYRIDIEDRIVLSDNLTQAAVRTFLTNQGFIGAGGGRFFLNGVDTETQGVELVASYGLPETALGEFDLTFGASFNETKVTRTPSIPVLSGIITTADLFSRLNVLTFEQGTPSEKFTLGVDWTLGGFSATARAVRYGEVGVPQVNPALDFTLDAATVLDLEARYSFNENVTVAIGADNVLDEYPSALPIALNTTGNVPFTSTSPFGYSGRFVFGKLNLSF
jgi:iron complex outermembrane recepter protein